ncbi:MAG: RHS repeat-associated core domain-containing protein [Lentisphaeria bacterium]
MRRDAKRIRIPNHPLWLKTTAWILMPVHLLSTMPAVSLSAAESVPIVSSPAGIAFKAPPPVLTPTKVKVNRTVPKVTPMPPAPSFSGAPSDEEFLHARGFPVALLPMGGRITSPEENRDLADAILAHWRGNPERKIEAITGFLDKHPQSPWRASLEAGLGVDYRQAGYFSRAITAWENAWRLTRGEVRLKTREIADQVLGDLAQMYAWAGNQSKLQVLFAEMGSRQVRGSTTEKIAHARQILDMIRVSPEATFKCGAQALGHLLEVQSCTGTPQGNRLTRAQATAQGMSLTQLQVLARDLGGDYQMAKRAPGSAVVVPCVVHWKLGHYSALKQKKNNRYQMEDQGLNITSSGSHWIGRRALDAESSGYFLVPAGKLPSGWQTVTAAEGGSIWGRGPVATVDPNNTGKCDDKSDPGCSPCSCDEGSVGMPVCNIHLAVVSLNIVDTPVGYKPPYGPAMPFTVTYNQREANQPTPFTYGNLGPKWNFNWLAVLDGSSTDAKLMMAGGGGRTYTYIATNQTYAPQMRNQSVLTTGATNLVSQIQYPDGSREIYTRAATNEGYYLTQRTDPQGLSVTLSYNYTNGISRLEALTDALGQVTSIAYEHPTDSSKITKVTDPFGRSATFQYDDLGRLSQITDVIGMTSSFAYDGDSDFIKAMTTPYGTTRFEKSEGPGVSRSLEITDPIGRKERAEFSQDGPEPSEQVPAYDTWWFGGGALHYRNTFYWDHEAMQQGPGDRTKAKVFHWLHNGSLSSGILESEKSPLENRVWYRYQGQDYHYYINSGMIAKPYVVARVLDNAQPVLQQQLYRYRYNAIGNVTNAIDAVGRTTVYDYADNLMDLLSVQRNVGGTPATVAQFTYNDQHLPTQITDQAGQTTIVGYNANGQVTSIQNAKGETTQFNYTGGYLTSVVGPGSVTLASYTYDAFGRVQTVTDSAGYTVTVNYDSLNRPTLVSYPDGTSEQIVYDKLDAVMHRDRIGRWSRTYYNEVRQRVAVEDALHRVTKFAWCKCGAPSAITDPNGNVTRWIRDLQGRVINKAYSDGSSETYTYESESGRLKTAQDGSGRARVYSYNFDDTVSSVAYSDGTSVSFTYDSSYRRVATMTDSTGTTTYAYNAAGQLGAGSVASVASPLPNSAYVTLAYSYDQLGRITNSAVDGVSSGVGYDSLGRTISAANPLGSFSYGYVGATARLSSVGYPNGQSTTFSYYGTTGDLRLQQISNLTATNSTLSQFSYEYDVTGQITKWTRQVDTETPTAYQFGYDAANQLISAVLKNTSTSAILKQYGYTYDPAGNRTSEQVDNTVNSAAHNNLNQLLSRQGGGKMRFSGTLSELATVTVGGNPGTVTQAVSGTTTNVIFAGLADVTVGTNVVSVVAKGGGGITRTNRYQVVVSSGITQTLAYDPSGNLVSRSGGGSSTTYEWDVVNRLKAINNGTHRTEFTYDGFSRRVRIVEKEGETVTSDKRLVWVGTDIAEERDSTGATVMKRYFPQGVSVFNPSSSVFDSFYYTRDHIGSIREVTDSTGAIQARYDYDPYGRRTKASGVFDSDFGFTGHYYHALSGLHLALYRAYDADLGRWLSRDPIAENGGINLYAYVGNRPVKYIDPYGEFTVIELPVVLGLLALAAVALAYGVTVVLPNITAHPIYTPSYTPPSSPPTSQPVPVPEPPPSQPVPVPTQEPSALPPAIPNVVDSSKFPPGYLPGDIGSDEWGRRHGVGAKEGRCRFHNVAKRGVGGRSTDDFGVNPVSGDVCDPNGDPVGNLNDIPQQTKGSR